MGATGLWRTPDVPQRGWTVDMVYDLLDGHEDGDLITCEMCTTQQIRYVHVMSHPNYRTLNVGAVCASRLETSYAAEQAERHLRNRTQRRSSRRARWLTRNWRSGSKPGYQTLKANGQRMTVFPKGSGFNYVIGDGKFGPGGYPTSDAAKLAVFDVFFNIVDPPA